MDSFVLVDRRVKRLLKQVADDVSYIRGKELSVDNLATAILEDYVKRYYAEAAKKVEQVYDGEDNEKPRGIRQISATRWKLFD